MRNPSALIAYFKNEGKQKSPIFNLNMQQPRIPPPTAARTPSTNMNSNPHLLPQPDLPEPFPSSVPTKNFQHSHGFSETYFSNNKALSLQKEAEPMEVEEPDHHPSPLNFSTELRKAELLYPPQDKLKKYKAMLPDHLSVVFHPHYQNLIKIATQTDKILQQKIQQSKMQSFDNIKNELKVKHNLDITVQMLLQMNFLVKGCYLLFKDPLNNLVVGLPSGQTLLQRKYKLKQQLYSFVNKQNYESNHFSEIYIPIPQIVPDIHKRPNFFPLKKLKEGTEAQSKISPKFVSYLEKFIEEKESSLKNINCLHFKPQRDDVEWFVSELEKLYKRHKVSYIYRVNIVDWFERQGLQAGQTLPMLKAIEKTHLFLHPANLPQKHPIYQLKPTERTLLLNKLAPQ